MKKHFLLSALALSLFWGCSQPAPVATPQANSVAQTRKAEGLKWSESGVYDLSIPKLEAALDDLPEDKEILFHLLRDYQNKGTKWESEPRLALWANKLKDDPGEGGDLARQGLARIADKSLRKELNPLRDAKNYRAISARLQKVEAATRLNSPYLAGLLFESNLALGVGGPGSETYLAAKNLISNGEGEQIKSRAKNYVEQVDLGMSKPETALAGFWKAAAAAEDGRSLVDSIEGHLSWIRFLGQALKGTTYKVKGWKIKGNRAVAALVLSWGGHTGTGTAVLKRSEGLWKVDLTASQLGFAATSLNDPKRPLQFDLGPFGRSARLTEEKGKVLVSEDDDGRTEVREYPDEGMATRGARRAVGYGPDKKFESTVDCFIIWNPAMRTKEGLGVGSRLSEWLTYYKFSDSEYSDLSIMLTAHLNHLDGKIVNLQPKQGHRWATVKLQLRNADLGNESEVGAIIIN